MINEITRPNTNSGSCNDLIMTNCAFVISSGVLNDYISDHYTVYSVWKKKRKIRRVNGKPVGNIKIIIIMILKHYYKQRTGIYLTI